MGRSLVFFFVLMISTFCEQSVHSASVETQQNVRRIEKIVFTGLEATREDVILDLFPRAFPTEVTDSELQEFSRRIKNLGLFDVVESDIEKAVLKVSLRHKSTLSPIIGFSSGKTFRDSSATLGLIEHDFLGTASKFGAKIAYAERGINFAAWLDQQPYSATKWAKEYELYRTSSGFRFASNISNWSRNRVGGFLEWLSPFHYGGKLRYEFQVSAYYETFSNQVGPVLPLEGLYVGGLFEIIYDSYRWDDLTPSGYRFVLELRPGALTRGTFRGEARIKVLAAATLSKRTAFYLNASSSVVNSGDVNHSLLIGSQQGVRGLPDSFYRSAVASFVNLELRHAVPIWSRVYLQPILFLDSAAFNSMDSAGHPAQWTQALSTGLGLRVVPTGLTDLLFRVDGSRLLLPSRAWLVQVGISQYF